MKIRLPKKRLFLLLLFFTFLSGHIYSQSVRFEVDSALFYLGQPFSASIVIQNGKPEAIPNLAVLGSRFNITYLGQSRSTQTSIRNGKSETIKAVMFNYRLTPLVEGDLSIPPIRVLVNGKAVFTEALKINVIKPGEIEGFKLQLIKTKERSIHYVGEPITLEFHFTSPAPVGGLSFEGDLTKPNEFYSFDGFIKNNYPNQEVILLEGLQVPAGFEKSLVNQQYLFSVKLSLQITPKKSGNIYILSENLLFQAGLEKDLFGNYIATPMIQASNKLTLKVLDLPPEIRLSPNGIIFTEGELKCEASGSTSRLLEGDPLTYTIDFSGITNLTTVNIPPFSTNKTILNTLKNQFSVKNDGSLRNQKKDDNTIYRVTEILTPLSREVKEIPLLSFTYFNLETGEVMKAKTDPVNLEILPANSATLKIGNNPENQNNLLKTSEDLPLSINFFPDFRIEEIIKGNNKNYTFSTYLLYTLFLPVSPIVFLIIFIRRKINQSSIDNSKKYCSPGTKRKIILKLKRLINEDPSNIDITVIEGLVRNYSTKTNASHLFLEFSEALRYKGAPPDTYDIQRSISLTQRIIDESKQIKPKKKTEKGRMGNGKN